ncbi:Unknown protein, partial [Striga hermonthica]
RPFSRRHLISSNVSCLTFRGGVRKLFRGRGLGWTLLTFNGALSLIVRSSKCWCRCSKLRTLSRPILGVAVKCSSLLRADSMASRMVRGWSSLTSAASSNLSPPMK